MAKSATITLNQLADYLTASPGRRRAIVEDMLDPKPYIVAVYNDASDLMRRYCSAGADAAMVWDDGIAALSNKMQDRTISDGQRQNAKLSFEAASAAMPLTAALAQVGDPLMLKGCAQGMSIEGVQVNVRPDLLLQKDLGGNKPHFGAVKFYFPKTKKLSKERANYAGAILQMYCEQIAGDWYVVDENMCLIVDAFGNAILPAPKHTKRRRDDIANACDEIRIRYESGS